MISVASEVFSYKKKNPTAIPEEVFQHITDYIDQERVRDEKTKVAMIAAAGKAFEIARKNPGNSEKILLKQFLEEIPEILNNISEE